MGVVISQPLTRISGGGGSVVVSPATGAVSVTPAAGQAVGLPSGAVINFNSGDVTITHSTDALAFAGAANGYTFDAPVSATRLTLTAAASVIVPGATSLSLRNTANTADNLLLTDAGAATLRNTVTVSTSTQDALVVGDGASRSWARIRGSVARGTTRVMGDGGSSRFLNNISTADGTNFVGDDGTYFGAALSLNPNTTAAGSSLSYSIQAGVGTSTLTSVWSVTGAGAVTQSGALTVSAGGATITGTLALGASNLTTTGTISATGARVTQSYHTNITSTNAVTVDSSLRSKVPESIQDYAGDALALLAGVRVVSYRHLDRLDPTKRRKLGVVAETLGEPLALQEIGDPAGGAPYPGVNLMGLAALQVQAIQRLSQRLTELERRLGVAAS